MNFELSERFRSSHAPEQVWRTVTEQLQRISARVTTEGDAVVARSVEATFGSINRTDSTRVRLHRKEDGYLLTANVTYRPSGWFWIFFIVTLVTTWVFWVVPLAFYLYQKNTVKNALSGALKRVRDEVETLGITVAPTSAAQAPLPQVGEATRFCVQCGMNMVAYSVFCGSCGARAGDAVLPVRATQSKGLSTAAKVGIGAAAVGVAGAAVAAEIAGGGELLPINSNDSNGDGIVDQLGFDRDGDGSVDAVAIDGDHNGAVDLVGFDNNGDAIADVIGSDLNGDGLLDVAGADLNGDGILDSITSLFE